MVARGDLGVEIPATQVPVLQKQMIRKGLNTGKLVVTAGVPLGKVVETNLLKAHVIDEKDM